MKKSSTMKSSKSPSGNTWSAGLDELCADGRMHRNYCASPLCGYSRDIRPLNFVSHSFSMCQLAYVFHTILANEPLSSRTVVDVGSHAENRCPSEMVDICNHSLSTFHQMIKVPWGSKTCLTPSTQIFGKHLIPPNTPLNCTVVCGMQKWAKDKGKRQWQSFFKAPKSTWPKWTPKNKISLAAGEVLTLITGPWLRCFGDVSQPTLLPFVFLWHAS